MFEIFLAFFAFLFVNIVNTFNAFPMKFVFIILLYIHIKNEEVRKIFVKIPYKS